MQGLVNRAIERFVRDTYGRDTWMSVIQPLDLGYTEFEAMLGYDPALTPRLIAAIATELDKPVPEVMEDIGTYLVSHPEVEALRRLLRFGGVSFVEFLHSLDDLPERARLAVADLHLPRLELRDHTASFFSLAVNRGPGGLDGFGHVMIGLLRSMADDYGALVLLDHKGARGQTEIIEIRLLESAFAEGRAFDLGAGVSP